MFIPSRELLFLMSGKGTFLGMFFSFAPVVGVEHFRVFLGQERCVFFCAPKKNACGHPLHLNLHLDLELLFYLNTHCATTEFSRISDRICWSCFFVLCFLSHRSHLLFLRGVEVVGRKGKKLRLLRLMSVLISLA